MKAWPVFFALLVIACCNCCMPPFQPPPEPVHTDYFLEAAGPVNLTTTSQVDFPVPAILMSKELASRRLYLGLFRSDRSVVTEEHEISAGQIKPFWSMSDLSYTAASKTYIGWFEGSYSTLGQTLYIQVDLIEDVEEYRDITITGTCSLASAQQAIEEIRTPLYSNNISAAVFDINWLIQGWHNDVAFELEGVQSYHGRSHTDPG